LPSGDCGQWLASWRARARNAATLTPWGDGAAAAGWDVRADADGGRSAAGAPGGRRRHAKAGKTLGWKTPAEAPDEFLAGQAAW
jgi:hypothetical protein